MYLKRERATLESFLPNLDRTLAGFSLQQLEQRESHAYRAFREARGPGLVIPREFGGLGATPLEAIRSQRAIAVRAPSLAVATTMHHATIAAVVERCQRARTDTSGMKLLLQSVAQQNLLVASGFAEGRSGTSDFVPLMRARPDARGFLVSGSKKPCSLTWSMDLLTASARLPTPSARFEMGVILVPANSEGLERRLFWDSPVLAGTESDEVVLRDVIVPHEMVLPLGNPTQINEFMLRGLLWFEMLISASYLGIASAVVERALAGGRGESCDVAALGIETESAMAALEGIASGHGAEEETEDAFVRALFVRYAVTRSIDRVTASAVELLGGMAFVRSFDVAYLLAAARALAFHPPSRTNIAPAMTEYLRGAPVSEMSVGLGA
jgi:alkylation response protein AidB-like acyl-CoA dehydrogenase